MKYESSRLYVTKGTHRSAIVKKAPSTVTEDYVVYFYYDNEADFEWKRGAHGMNCDLCDTIEQAKRKANYYVNKDKEV